MVSAIRERRLFKRALEVPAFALADYNLEWLADDRDRIRLAEDALAASLGLRAGELLLDFPRKERMLGLDLPLLAKDGSVHRLTDAGLAGTLNLPILGEQLYQSARWLRVFTAERRSVALGDVLAVLNR